MRATCTRAEGVRHLLAAYELGEDKLYGHIKPRKTRTRFPGFCRYLRSLYSPEVRIAIICDNCNPHLITARDSRVGAWAAASNVEIAYTPSNALWLNWVEVNRPSGAESGVVSGFGGSCEPVQVSLDAGDDA
jgi:hypothetical protein